MSRAAQLRAVGPLAVAGIVNNAGGVIVTVALSRLLGDRDYGALAQLLGVSLVLQMPGSALLVGVVRRMTAWSVEGRHHEAATWAAITRRNAARGVALAAVASPVVGVAVGWLLDVRVLGVAAVTVSGAVWAALSVERGLLQSRLAFPTLAANVFVEATGRTAGMLVLVALDLGVVGATFGLLAGTGSSWLHARRAVDRVRPGFARDDQSAPAVVRRDTDVAVTAPAGRSLAVDSAAALGSLALLALLQSADVIVLGRLEPDASGDYAAVSVSSKAVVFLAIVLAGYLLPEAATRHQRGERSTGPLAVAAAALAAPVGALVLIGAVAGRPFLAAFFGERLDDASGALAPLAAAMGCLALTYLCAQHLLAIGRRSVVVVLGAGAAFTVPALVAAGGRPVATARVDLACQAALAVVAVAFVARAGRVRGGGDVDPVRSGR